MTQIPQAYQSNFTSGEISPLIEGRVDLAKYYNGCALLENMLVMPQGGAARRGGTRYIADVKTHAKTVRLVGFQYSTEQAYVLEFGDLYVRFYKDQGQIQVTGTPYEIVTPFTMAQLPKLSFAQSADVLYIAHPSHRPRKLLRLGHTDWRLLDCPFDYQPIDTDYWAPATTLTPGAVSGTGVTFTAAAAVFLAGDVGKSIKFGVARAKIVSITSSTVVKCDILDPFPDTNPIPSGSWQMHGAGNAQAKYKIHDADENFTNEGTAQTLRAMTDGFRASDAGKYLRFLGGAAKITSFTDANYVEVKLLKDLSVGYAPTSTLRFGLPQMESPVWGTDKWPGLVSFYGNRLIFAASTVKTQSIWGSKVGDFENFIQGINYDDAFAFTLSARQANSILWLAPAKDLFIGTIGAEWRMTGGGGEPLSPVNVLALQESSRGVAAMAPEIIGQTVVFVDRFRQGLFQILFTLQEDSYKSNDLTLLNPDICKPGIADLAYAPKPHSVLWTPRDDGVLCSLTLMQEHEVMGWARQITDGVVERACAIPGATETEVWLVVRRTIGGQTKRFIELMQSNDYADVLADAWFVDCGLKYSGVAATVITGLDHLAGKTVAVLADGKVHPNCVVGSVSPNVGKITLNYAASKVIAGLPYTAKLQTMRLNMPSSNQQGFTKRVHEVVLRFYKAMGGKVGTDADNLENINLGAAVPYTGDLIVKYRGGWETDAKVYLEHGDPTPFTLLAAMPRFVVGAK